MEALLIINTVVFVLLHVVWMKNNLVNFFIKVLFFVLFVGNAFHAYQVSEANTQIRKAEHANQSK